jgi:hypothetical protein
MLPDKVSTKQQAVCKARITKKVYRFANLRCTDMQRYKSTDKKRIAVLVSWHRLPFLFRFHVLERFRPQCFFFFGPIILAVDREFFVSVEPFLLLT